MIFAKLNLDQIHAYVEKGSLTLRYDGMIFDSISQAYRAPARPKTQSRTCCSPRASQDGCFGRSSTTGS